MRLSDITPSTPERIAELKERFWSRVDIGEENECWPFTGWTGPHGKARMNYGRFRVGRERPMTAHRVAYLFVHGEVDDALFVCHRCDFPPCCNPAHLFAGTGKENADDRDHKGRYVLSARLRGEANGNSKLSEEIVADARRRVAQGALINSLASEYGISGTSLSAAVKGCTWKHVSTPVVSSEVIAANRRAPMTKVEENR